MVKPGPKTFSQADKYVVYAEPFMESSRTIKGSSARCPSLKFLLLYFGVIRMNLLFELFLTFAKIGTFTFGGGYAMMSIISNICVEQKKWISHDEMMDITVIAESTPGPFAIPTATYVGYKQGGIPGSIASTIGIVLPSFLIIYLISTMLDNFLEIAWISNAFKGIKIGVGILILRVAVNMLKKMKSSHTSRMIVGCAFAAMLTINFLALKISSISLMLIAAFTSLCIFFVKEQRGGEGK